MNEQEINQWVISILTLWDTDKFYELIEEYYAKDLSYRNHMKIMDKVYTQNQLAYYDTENILTQLLNNENN